MSRVFEECSLVTNKLNIEDMASKLGEDQRGPY